MGFFRGQVCLLEWAPRSVPKTRWWSWLNVMFVDVFWARWLNQLVWLQHVHGKASCHIVYLWHHGTSVESSMKIFRTHPTIHQPFTKHRWKSWSSDFVRPSVNQCGISTESIVPCRKSLFSSLKSCSFHGFNINSDFLATINWGG
jgi:hypothetical protein